MGSVYQSIDVSVFVVLGRRFSLLLLILEQGHKHVNQSNLSIEKEVYIQLYFETVMFVTLGNELFLPSSIVTN